MDETNLHKRVNDLEQQIKAFRTSLKPGMDRFDLAAPTPNSARVVLTKWILFAVVLVLLIAVYAFGIHFSDAYRNASAAKQWSGFVGLLLTNWTLVVFVGTLLVAVYVQVKFGFDYFFENYRNASTTKDLSRFYEQMGDRLMAISEWAAAEEAYGTALKINANNTTATLGIVKAQVFHPSPGEKLWIPEVVDARLAYLFCRCPNDYQIDFLQGLRYKGMWRYEEAAASFKRSIQKNPKFSGGYGALGSLAMVQSDISAAQVHYTKAVELDPSSAVARNDLGVCLMLLSEFSHATEQFTKSYQISPTALIASALGEACWFSLNFRDALGYHQDAADYLNTNPDLQDRYTIGGWRATFCPLQKGDLETIKRYAVLRTPEEKKAFLHFELAIDHALLEEFDEAQKEINVAMKLTPAPQIRRLVQNRMQALENRLKKMSDATKNWLGEHRQKLD